MRQITVTGTVRADGLFTVQVPVDIPAGDYQAIIVVDDTPATMWPPHYFESTFGSIPDLERPDQGMYEEREALP